MHHHSIEKGLGTKSEHTEEPPICFVMRLGCVKSFEAVLHVNYNAANSSNTKRATATSSPYQHLVPHHFLLHSRFCLDRDSDWMASRSIAKLLASFFGFLTNDDVMEQWSRSGSRENRCKFSQRLKRA
jgi:hypothetical protein